MLEQKWSKKYYNSLLLPLSLAMIFSAIFFLSTTVFTSKNSLIAKKGEIQSVQTYYKSVSNTDRILPSKSTKSSLHILLKEHSNIFALRTNIGSDKHNEKYEKIRESLKASKRATIYIQKNDSLEIYPQIFGIEVANGISLYSLSEAKVKYTYVFILQMTVGLLLFGLYLRNKLPKKFKHLIGF